MESEDSWNAPSKSERKKGLYVRSSSSVEGTVGSPPARRSWAHARRSRGAAFVLSSHAANVRLDTVYLLHGGELGSVESYTHFI